MRIVFKRTNFGAALLGALLCMVILFLITLYRDGGNLHAESSLFFTNYLDGRSLMQKIFDPVRNDWGCYQARELSYLFDLLDAHFVAFLLKRKIIWFHSICSLLLCGMMVFVQQYFTRKFFPGIPGLLVTFISLFFVLSSPVSGLDYFRCAKYLTALGLWGAFFAGFAVFRWNKTSAKICFILSLLLMTLSDRQGFYFTAALCGTAAVVMFYQSLQNAPVSSTRMRFVVLAPFCITCFGIINNLYLTPAMIRAVNNCDPDFSYQREIAVHGEHFYQGFLFLFGNLGNWFNNFHSSHAVAALTGVLLACGVAAELCRRYRKGKRTASHLALCWGCLLAAMYICSVVMVARLDLMLEFDLFFGVYSMTFMVIFLGLVTLTAPGGGKKFCTVLLAFFGIALALRLGTELMSDKFYSGYALENGCKMRQQILKEALKDHRVDVKNQCIPYRMELFLQFYREHLLTKE